MCMIIHQVHFPGAQQKKQQERKALLAPTDDSANLHMANMWKAEGWDSEDKLAGYIFDTRNTFVSVSSSLWQVSGHADQNFHF